MREVHRGSDRFHTVAPGIQTWHSFAYGAHYDPERIGFGPVMAINVEHVEPGAGYAEHRHSDVEIVTWVVDGSLRHEDSTGTGDVLRPGAAQRLSAGPGVEHTERNASSTQPLTFIQLMLRTTWEGDQEYAAADVAAVPGTLAPTVAVHADAEVLLAVVAAGRPVLVPAVGRRLVHVVSGSLAVGGGILLPGDELRTDDDAPFELVSDGPAEALVLMLAT